MSLAKITPSTLISPAGREAAKAIFTRLDVAPTTASEYGSRVGCFLDFLEKEGLHPGTFQNFKNHLRTKLTWSTSTKNKYLVTARIFVKELHKHRPDLVPSDFTANVRSFSQSKKHKRPGITAEEFSELTSIIVNLGPRHRAMIVLLAFQGLRQVEVCRLNVEDLDLPRQRAFVQGKGEDDREPVALHPETVTALGYYLEASGLRSGPLFLSRDFHRGGQRLSTRGLRGIVKGILGDAGIDKHVHAFRHHFTTRLLQAFRGDILTVMKFTRHQSPEMLQVYNDDLDLQKHLPTFYKAFDNASNHNV